MAPTIYQPIVKKSIVFTLLLTGILSLYIIVLTEVLLQLSDIQIPLITKFSWIVLFSLGSFFLINHRIKKYIHSKISEIYNSVSILDVKDVENQIISTDLETLKKEVIKFAETKRLEIENLRNQEEFRRDFIGNLAHELKTPLFTVQSYLETLFDGAAEDQELLYKYLDRANKGVTRLIDITKDLDLITKLETGDQDLNMSVFDIDDLCTSIIDLLEIKANSKDITLEIENNLPPGKRDVYADKEKIEVVLTNLISNSIKYGNQSGNTKIILKIVKGKIQVEVSDNGEGIKKIHLQRIFERFYRVDRHRSREVGGSGLGLSIVKHILEAHGERINVESEFSLGTTFYFTLPVAK